MFDEKKVKLTTHQAKWIIEKLSKGHGISNAELSKAIPQLYPYERSKQL